MITKTVLIMLSHSNLVSYYKIFDLKRLDIKDRINGAGYMILIFYDMCLSELLFSGIIISLEIVNHFV